MGKRGVKPGTKREPYRKKSLEEKEAQRAARVAEAEELLPIYLEPAVKWSKDWRSPEMLEKAYLAAFAGLTPQMATRIFLAPEKEILEALKAFPELKAHWDRGDADVVGMCHTGLALRMRGMKITEVRKTEKADGGIETTTIVKELPPCVDSIKFFLSKRVSQYQELNPAAQFENRLDTMLSKFEQLDLFS